MPVCSFRNIIDQYKKRRFVISCLASAQNHGFSHFTMSLTNTQFRSLKSLAEPGEALFVPSQYCEAKETEFFAAPWNYTASFQKLSFSPVY